MNKETDIFTAGRVPNDATKTSWLEGKVRMVQARRFEDTRGSLVPFSFDELPFMPRRLFVVCDVPVNTIRGCHAHLKQRHIFICLAGEVEVAFCLDDQHHSIKLDHPESGLLIEPGVWTAQKFAVSGSVLLVLASSSYDPRDYVNEGVNVA